MRWAGCATLAVVGLGAGCGRIPTRPANAYDARQGYTLAGDASGNGSAAAAAQYDDPVYTAWARFKPGSTVTLFWDDQMIVSGKVFPQHHEMQTILDEVTPMEVRLSTRGLTILAGQRRPDTLIHMQRPAKTATPPPQPVGEQDVVAAGQTFHCRVYKYIHPGATGPQKEVTLYANDSIPGGQVRMDMPAPLGGMQTMLLLRYTAK